MIRTSISMLLLMATVLFSSCITHKKSTLFQDTEPYEYTSNDTFANQLPTLSSLKIQPYDMLTISVNSASKALGNLTGSNESGAGYSSPFTIDANGEVQLPMIGAVKLQGLTVEEAESTLKEQLTKYLVDPFVDVQFLTFKVNVIGEVGMQGIKALPSEEATLLDALAMSGGIKETGNVSTVKVIRQLNDGREVVFVIDLSKIESLEAPGYHLMPHDIVYVEPLKRKFFVSNLTLVSAFVAIANAAVTVTALIISIRNR